jgi:anion-transporting  ArsA/GET3 family ATPase
MAVVAQERTSQLASSVLPRIIFVLGKGGVGRSTVAAALGLLLAERGERVLVAEWAIADSIGPWFGTPPVGATAVEVAPNLAVNNFSLDEALRAYFVDHLHVGLVYRHIIRSRPVARMLDVAPGLAEMFFLGQLWWLTTLAEREAGLRYDRIVVDAPATGHATSLLDIPTVLSGLGAGSLLAVETHRVVEMMVDPARTGAIVVTLPEPLVVDETLELVPRVTARLGRAPLALVVNRSAAAIASDDARPSWLATLGARLSKPSRDAIVALHDELRARLTVEHALQRRIATPNISLPELPGRPPIDVVRAVAHTLEAR